MTHPKHKYILISGGGTGGHIFPALAIGREIEKQNPHYKVVFVGAKDRMEMEKIPAAGYPIHGLWISGLQRKLTLSNLLFPLKLLWSLGVSHQLLNKYKPKAVIGVGGYASGPLMWAAAQNNLPHFIQEQNSFPGITNKWRAAGAQKIYVAFKGLEKFFPQQKIQLTGNPVRAEIIKVGEVSKKDARLALGLNPDKKTILVTGGSLGARAINQAIEIGLSELDENEIQLIWQTGKNYTGSAQPKWGKRLVFIEDMVNAYAAADVVVSRAGALSISELCVAGKAAVLVPSPYVAEDHQTHNAKSLTENNAADWLPEKKVAEQLVAKMISLAGNADRVSELEKNIKLLAKPNATEVIVKDILDQIDN